MKRNYLRRVGTAIGVSVRRVLASLRRYTNATIDHMLVAQLSGRRVPSLKQFTYLFRVLNAREWKQFAMLFFIALASGAWMSVQVWRLH